MKKHSRSYRAIFAALEPLEQRLQLTVVAVNPTGAGGAYTDIQAAIDASSDGDTIQIAAGSYAASAVPALGNQTSIWIHHQLTLEGAGAGNTIINIPGQNEGLYVFDSNITVENLTVDGGTDGIHVEQFNDPTAIISNIDINNVDINPNTNFSNGSGVFADNTNGIIIQNCTIGQSETNGITIGNNVTNAVISNNSIALAPSYGIDLGTGSSGTVVSLNTIANCAGGIAITSSYNQVFDNTILGATNDSISLDNSADYNFIGMNTVNGGESGIFLNSSSSESDHNWIYGNFFSGAVENGIALFNVSDNLIQGNQTTDNAQGGIFLDFHTASDTTSTGGAPTNNVVTQNYSHDNISNGMIQLVGSTQTQISNNFLSATPSNANVNAMRFQDSANNSAYNNILYNISAGLFEQTDSTNLLFYHNREINVGQNDTQEPATVALDAGPILGGNYYSTNTGQTGDPGTVPYTQFIYGNGLTSGGYADAYPFADESLGLSVDTTVTEPAAATLVGAGSTKTIAWTSPAAIFVKLALSGPSGTTTIADQVPNTGIYSWAVPSTLASGDYTILVTPENSSGAAIGNAASSGALSVDNDASNPLILTSPTRGLRTSAGQSVRVAWAYNSTDAVNVEMQLGNGDWTTVATGITDGFTDITLPSGDAGPARFRVIDPTANEADTMDGYFQIQGTGSVTAAPTGTVAVGSQLPLSWISPVGSVSVNLSLINGSTTTSIAQNLPDFNSYTWSVPDSNAPSAQVQITFLDANGNSLGTAASGNFAIPGQGNAITYYTANQNPVLGGGGGGGGTASLSATLTAKFSGNLVGGSKTKIKGTVRVTNSSDTAFSASVPVSIFLSTSSTGPDGSDAVISKPLPLKLKAHQTKTIPLSFTIPAATAEGIYYLFAEAAPTGLTAAISTAAGPANIAPAFVDLGVSNLADTTPIVQGSKKKPKIKFTLANAGNVAAKGKATLELFASPDGSTADETLLSETSVSINLKANGGTKNFSASPIIAAGAVAPGNYTLIAMLTAPAGNNEPAGDLANNTEIGPVVAIS